MQKDLIKFAVSVVILVIILIILVIMCINGLIIGTIKISSISNIQTKHESITMKESELLSKELSYTEIVQNLKSVQSDFTKEKSKYEAISDETINIIKEATTEEKYTMEYMWIRLGNYAKKHNLNIMLIEPGGTATIVTPKTEETSNKSSSTSTTSTTSTNTETIIKAEANTLRVEIKGTYMDVSDFIFEVENDKELRFKLNNITMEYIEGTIIKTTFNVKNMIINK